MYLPTLSAVADAAASLGWAGEPVPVRACGEDAWAIAAFAGDDDRGQIDINRGALQLAGVIVSGSTGSRPVERASVFAGYCRRAVFVPDGPGLVSIQVDAALLGQGLVVATESGVMKLADPDPVDGLSTSAALAARARFHEIVSAAFSALA